MRLFILLSRFPHPLDKGDKLRAFHQIKNLSVNHEIILCAINRGEVTEEAVAALNPYCSQIHILPIRRISVIRGIITAFFNGQPFQVGYYYNHDIQRKIDLLISESRPEHIYCQLLRMAGYVLDQPVTKTLDFQDAFSAGMKRRFLVSNFITRPFIYSEYKRLKKYEFRMPAYFDNTVIISAADCIEVAAAGNKLPYVVPNGVDWTYFSPVNREKDFDLVFCGNMNYLPNVDAACYLAKEIFPKVQEKYPKVRLLIAGTNPNLKVRKMKSGSIEVSGWLPDIREAYARSRIFVAPMNLGSGMQNKLLEAMAMGVPCITSPLAITGLGTIETGFLLTGNDTADYVQKIIYLLDNQTIADTFAEKGRKFVESNYNWEKSTGILEEIFAGNYKRPL